MRDTDFNITADTMEEGSNDSAQIEDTESERSGDLKLSENVVEDLVEYTRSKTVKNEQQFVLTTLGYVSGFMESPKDYVSGVLIGTAGSGKSHLQNTVEEVFPEELLYKATSGTDKSIIYDDDWDDATIASLDELQKPSDEIIEILKSCFTEDTDVLTPGGVVRIAELDVGDEVYSWNPDTDCVEVKQVTDTIAKENNAGELVNISNQYVDLSMTPDHTVWRDQNGHGKEKNFIKQKAGDGFPHQTRLPHSTVKEGEELDTVDITEHVDCQCYTITGGEKEFVTYDEGHSWIPRYYDADEFLEYLAWYSAEGNIKSRSYGVTITQSDASEIVNLVESLGPSYAYNDGREGRSETVTIQNKVWQNAIVNLCGKGWASKRIPEFVFDCSVRQKELVLDTLMKGDGDSTEGHHRYTTGSDDLKDCVLRLVLETGSPPYYRWDEESNVWRISTYENKQTVKNDHVAQVSHDGSVYCVSVEDNHTLVAGRNGRFSHVGNCHGGEDEEFRYKITGDGRGADRAVDEIVREAMPYWFLYAQYEPDFEMWDRLLKVPVHESKEKNDGVARTQWDHREISFGEDSDRYIFDYSSGEQAIREHIRQLPQDARVKIPAGEAEFGWDAYRYARPMFDIGRSETNRVSSQIANLVRASALLNHKNREKRTIEIPGEGSKEGVIIASKQDVANILACRDVLLATTHQLDHKRKAICVAIDEVGGTKRAAPIKHPKDRQGQPKSIMGYLRKSDSSFVKRPQIQAMLGDLIDNGLVDKLEGAGDGGRSLYEFQSWQELAKFDIDESFKSTFEGCDDPFTERDFIATARHINDGLTPNAKEFMSEGESTVKSDSGQVTLSSDESADIDVDLAPHEQHVADLLRQTLGGEVIGNLDEHEPSIREMIGLVPLGEDDDSARIDGTILSPDHSVWSHGPDDWVTTVSEAEMEIENALRTLTTEGVFQTSVTETRDGEAIEMKVTVNDI